jgi:hypothetical protein
VTLKLFLEPGNLLTQGAITFLHPRDPGHRLPIGNPAPFFKCTDPGNIKREMPIVAEKFRTGAQINMEVKDREDSQQFVEPRGCGIRFRPTLTDKGTHDDFRLLALDGLPMREGVDTSPEGG